MTAGRMLLRTAKCLVMASVLLCMAPRSFAEVMPFFLTLKVVHADGVPVADQQVRIQLQYESGEKRQVGATTDSAGEARFRIQPRKPDSLRIEVRFNERGFRCACQVETEPESVVRTGLVIATRTRHPDTSAPIQAQPGKIIFVARPSSLLEKIIYDDY